ncbi:16S rRNA (guanine527-N7)-methyltransferase [Kineococcus xinjiangensis]|uniref:Ribosomal RNA small subunit methyltransferase G n=1 Tax=Kineococcus xinjiangensis TaxID=512762 RepID=A0A2S6II37_9ACTN|nr:16S rRNA (guanine(527)-N(7))-methyltransferase RsmG [Kineococcus xinjiangensis]PPK93846.1 16S rRNA (guanine527-N7)-methyltransferase [Kineococcus xinjiangensis]
MFGEAAELAQRYADLLATDGVTRGLIGPREVPRLWERHILNCAGLREVVPEGASVLDIGSGAGLPGIPLTLARPDLMVTLLEPLERRYHFLREVVSELQLGDRCRVVRGRAEDVRGELAAQVLTARAVAPLEKLAGWALPLTTTSGVVLAIKGRSADEEVEQAWPALQRWGVPAVPTVVTCETGVPDEDLTVVRVERGTGALRLPTAGGKQRPASSGGKKSGRRAAEPGSGRGRGSGAGRGR